MNNPNQVPIIVGAVDKIVAEKLAATEGPVLKSLNKIDALLAEANAEDKNAKQAAVVPKPATAVKTPTEYIVLIRHPVKKTLHPVMALKEGPGIVAVFESPELALSQLSTVKAAQNNEYYIIPVE